MDTTEIRQSMAAAAIRAAFRDLAAATQRLAAISAGLHGAVLNARESGLLTDQIVAHLEALASRDELAHALGDGRSERLRELVERYAQRELIALWNG
jgi:hypothetical protein